MRPIPNYLHVWNFVFSLISITIDKTTTEKNIKQNKIGQLEEHVALDRNTLPLI